RSCCDAAGVAESACRRGSGRRCALRCEIAERSLAARYSCNSAISDRACRRTILGGEARMTSNDRLNPQAREMADESMVRTLAAQAEAIWPQEAPLFARYQLPSAARILDGGCGTGEITSRLAALFPAAQLLGVDIIDEHLERARTRSV